MVVLAIVILLAFLMLWVAGMLYNSAFDPDTERRREHMDR